MYPYTILKSRNINGTAEFRISAQSNLHLLFPTLTRQGFPAFILSPGDAVDIDARNKNLQVCGKGSEKLNPIQYITRRIQLLQMPGKKRQFTLENFFLMSNYFDSSNIIIEEELALASDQIPPNILHQIKADLISDNEDNRGYYFELTRRQPQYKDQMSMFCKIYDSIIVNKQWKWLCSLTEDAGITDFYFGAIKAQIRRNHDYIFEVSSPLVDLGIVRRKQYYEEALRMFSGKILANVMYTIVGREGFHHYGFIPEMNQLLYRFYQSGEFDAEAKRNMQIYEKKERMARAVGNKSTKIPSLERADRQSGKTIIQPDDLKGKITLLHFYDPQTPNRDLLSIPAARFRNVPNSFVANVAVKSPALNDQLLPATWHFKESCADSILAAEYGIPSLPVICLYDSYGSLLKAYSPTDERVEGYVLANAITEQLQYMNDGPYVLLEGDRRTIITFEQGQPTESTLPKTADYKFSVNTDVPGATFCVTLADSLRIPPSVYPAQENVLVLSDLEGNFKALRQLLQRNNIIDDNFKWTFGNGHLVILGDMFDRGQQVTECLWLIYALERAAATQGGAVHFLLGNHEIMNLTGNLRYQATKYKRNMTLLKRTYDQIYSTNSELGKWLRTKNIIEQIGKSLFTHGGISPEVSWLGLNVESINSRVRDFLNNQGIVDTITLSLTDTHSSPFWYRGFYSPSDENKIIANLELALKSFNVHQIITGHTIVEEITAFHNGRLFNTDTHHAKGLSEGLLITDNIFYRVSGNGRRQKIWPE
ncbi:metallophosphoesterase [uncultured Chitinophaga sp.]|uniref:metallophosphoesterase n=1 Tax=uncultured Chitinophaga sp. TaxID=339340 RepID=UPI0025DCEFD5|nr:metallophosphoesterase [uncultured Chitinophaga sp.]